MQEAFLHYLWKHKKFRWKNATTATGKPLLLSDVGTHNQSESGPDFFNAKLKIEGQLWAGNVEIHLKASDWYAHHHETDPAFDNVILHVVWENDSVIYRKDNTPIPTLELQPLVKPQTLKNYQNLLGSDRSKWINCEKDFGGFGEFEMSNWLERLYIERLEQKSELLLKLLEQSANNWEAVLFKMLAKNFGLNVNGTAFLNMANSFPFQIVQKLSQDRLSLEALFFGQAGMLEEIVEEPYYLKLQQEYAFLKKKYKLDNTAVSPVKYFRLRPDNFPTVRLAQLAALYAERKQLFSKLIATKHTTELYNLFNIRPSAFWQKHYTFQKESKKRPKELTPAFIDLLIINTLVPLKFCYAKFKGNFREELIFPLMKSLEAESNKVVSKFNTLRPKTATSALDSQALLQLKKNYCAPNRCLQCALGVNLLQQN